MKAVILWRFGTRLDEETTIKPKPMVEIGGRPILWHIMKLYSAYGINDFIICCGYMGYKIKEYTTTSYTCQMSRLTCGLIKCMFIAVMPNLAVTLIDTGEKQYDRGGK